MGRTQMYNPGKYIFAMEVLVGADEKCLEMRKTESREHKIQASLYFAG